MGVLLPPQERPVAKAERVHSTDEVPDNDPVAPHGTAAYGSSQDPRGVGEREAPRLGSVASPKGNHVAGA